MGSTRWAQLHIIRRMRPTSNVWSGSSWIYSWAAKRKPKNPWCTTNLPAKCHWASESEPTQSYSWLVVSWYMLYVVGACHKFTTSTFCKICYYANSTPLIIRPVTASCNRDSRILYYTASAKWRPLLVSVRNLVMEKEELPAYRVRSKEAGELTLKERAWKTATSPWNGGREGGTPS